MTVWRRAGTLAMLAAIGAGLLAGCSGALQGKKIDYKSAGKLPPLEVPPDLAAPPSSGRYTVPEVGGAATYSEYEQQRGGANRPVAATGASAVLPQSTQARMERGGNQRWLVVRAEPAQVWPVVREFWQESGFLIKVEDQGAGTMETDWAENRAKIPVGGITGLINKALDSVVSLPERDKFRTRLERGQEAGTTEIYVSHKGMAEVYYRDRDNNTKWQVRPTDTELEAEMLGRLALRFGVQSAGTTDPRVVAKVADKAPPRAVLAPGATTLTLNDGFDRAWRRVGLALDRIGFMVEDRNRADGLYYVRYQDPDAAVAKKSALSKLAFWRSDDGSKEAEQYRVQVASAGTGASANTEIKVLNREGVADGGNTAKRILNLLVEQLQ